MKSARDKRDRHLLQRRMRNGAIRLRSGNDAARSQLGPVARCRRTRTAALSRSALPGGALASDRLRSESPWANSVGRKRTPGVAEWAPPPAGGRPAAECSSLLHRKIRMILQSLLWFVLHANIACKTCV